ncbi:MAG TPA: 3-oxoacid CoA-transferase subunit A [Petrotogaceae bacterium]|jgi:acetate CoA/acetoacetate CoA-transferase alpha subunit|nr:3-oxoacid CoA-transferase subunit A [Petrotogaceae bacterium]HNY37369.1 3-oxoacid CoA-transferase subunit A [Petrotogaceae bacterium]HOT30776.1 3-oxoacid CoA-transferase subunit A [Petrotogaceae bacterium]HPA93135.1 3-oxoacid CoA-transferase subunit A [Petrotogaceae bacterium]HPO26982.1 3-oxoacid CoA-transferase subunit A [Petrotogaceae bacterium]
MEVLTAHGAVGLIGDDTSLMIGGFLGVGTPESIITELIAQKKKGLTVIGNDSAFPDKGIGRLISEQLVKKLIVSHIGTNPVTQKQMIEKSLEVELVPQGSLIEKIRAGGVGLGGILTPTGVGTVVEESKQIIESEGQKYILELPIKAKFALIKAKKADYMGNLFYSLTAKNFNPLIALAADIVIAEVEEIVPVGSMSPEEIHTPGILVDYVVVGGKKNG